MTSTFKKIVPYLVAFVTFLLVAIFYFSPQLSGKQIQQYDITAYKAASKEVRDYRASHSDQSLWTNSMFGGMPAYVISVEDRGNKMRDLRSFLKLGFANPIGNLLVCMFCMFLGLVFLGVNPWLAIVGGLAFGLTTNHILLMDAGHNSKLETTAYFALIGSGVILAFRGRMWIGALIYAIGLALSLSSNHPQMLYYLAMTLIILFIAVIIQKVRQDKLTELLKTTGVLLVATLLALATGILPTVTNYEYSKDTVRGEKILSQKSPIQNATAGQSDDKWNWSMNWSNGWNDVLSTIVPGIVGGSGSEKIKPTSKVGRLLRSSNMAGDRAPMYWGKLPGTGGPSYLGVVVVFLALFSALIMRGPVRNWLIGGIILTLLLSMGKHFSILNRPLYDFLPLFSKFRTPNSVIIVTEFLTVFLAILGLNQYLKSDLVERKNILKKLYITAGVLGGACLILALLGGSLFSFTSARDAAMGIEGQTLSIFQEDRQAMLQRDALRSFLFIALTAASIWFFNKGKLKKEYLIAILGLLILGDNIGVANRYFSNDKFKNIRNEAQLFPQRPADKQILQDKDIHYRIHDLSIDTYNNSSSSYYHKTIGGYTAGKLRRYQDILDYYLQPLPKENPARSKGRNNVLNMLNTKYIIDQKQRPQRNPGNLGNAWFVNEVSVVDSHDDEINSLAVIDAGKQAAVHKEFSAQLPKQNFTGAGAIKLTSYAPNKLTYESDSNADQLAIFSEVFYGPNKGWQAYIDGNAVDHLRANYILRGLLVPSGNHKITFEFKPAVYQRSYMISLIASILLLLLMVLGLIYTLKPEWLGRLGVKKSVHS